MEPGEEESKKEYSGEINFNTSGNGVAAGGLRTIPEDADKFIRKFLSKEAGESSLFENAEVVEALFRDEGKLGKHNICGVNNYPGSVIRITPLSLLTLNSINLVLCSAPSAYACYASGAVLARG